MINTDTKEKYLAAIKDIRAVWLGPCSIYVIGILTNEGVLAYLRKWDSGRLAHGDIHSDFQAILNGLDKAINAHPREPWLRVMRGRALTTLGYFMAAIQDLDAAFGADSAERCLFLSEAYFAQARETLREPMAFYTSAAIYATKSIQFHTKDHHSPRPYLVRAQCDAWIIKSHGYHRKTMPFRKKHQDIEADLRMAREISDEAMDAEVSRIAENIKAILGAEEE